MTGLPPSRALSPPLASASEAERGEGPSEEPHADKPAIQDPTQRSPKPSAGLGIMAHQNPRVKMETPNLGDFTPAPAPRHHDPRALDSDESQNTSDDETLYEEPSGDAAGKHRDEVIDKIMERLRIALDKKISLMQKPDEMPTRKMVELDLHTSYAENEKPEPRYMARRKAKKSSGVMDSVLRRARTVLRRSSGQRDSREQPPQLSSQPAPQQLPRPAPLINLTSVRPPRASDTRQGALLTAARPALPVPVAAPPPALAPAQRIPVYSPREGIRPGASRDRFGAPNGYFPFTSEDYAPLAMDESYTEIGFPRPGAQENINLGFGPEQRMSRHGAEVEESKEEEDEDEDEEEYVFGFMEDSIAEPPTTGLDGNLYDDQVGTHPQASHASQSIILDLEGVQEKVPEVDLGTSEPPAVAHARTRPVEAEEGDHDGRRKKSKRAASDIRIGAQGKKFACPYFKRNPKKYSKWTSCPGPGWEEVHRVKTHLYRRHALPLQCPRCWESFKTDTLFRAHLQQDPPCTVSKSGTLLEGFTKDQEKKLRSRKKTHADMTDDDKWKEIYTVLFPDDDPGSIPSPYYENRNDDEVPPLDEFENYAKFVRREMPTLVRRELETLFEDEFRDIEERLRPRVAQIVLNLQPRLLQLYRQSSAESQTSDASDSYQQPGTSTEASATPATTSSNPVSEPRTDFQSPNFDWTDWQTPSSTDPASSTTGTDGSFDWDAEFDSLLNQSLFADVPVLLDSAPIQTASTAST